MLKKADHVTITEVDGEVVILDLNSGAYFGINHIGRQFLADIEAGIGLQQSASRIATEYGVDEHTVVSDLNYLTAELLDKALLEQI